MEPEQVVEDGLLKSIGGFTWPGIDIGHYPTFKYSFFQYIDALRFGDLELFKEIEEESGDWWFPTLDRGAGATLHFAAEHGQRCANMAHHRHAPYLEIFEYLLQQGADASLLSNGDEDTPPQNAVEVAVKKGRGWEPGQLRQKLQQLVDKYKDVPKRPPFTYTGGNMGGMGARILRAWEKSEPIVPPSNWRAPPPAGYLDAQGMRRVEKEPWRPAGENDGSFFTREMTELELQEQSLAAAAAD